MYQIRQLAIDDSSQVSAARRNVSEFARNLDFNDEEIEKASIVITELASNIIKHTNGGQLLVWVNERGQLEILSLDKGEGIRNIGDSLRDGYSTAGSRGEGLGAIQRLSTAFEIFSTAGEGTVVWCLLEDRSKAARPDFFSSAAISLPHPREIVIGDGWAIKKTADVCQILVVDGLGHGIEAEKASAAAMQIFNNAPAIKTPSETIETIHTALRPTRGAAVAVANLDTSQKRITFCGIGNISGVIVTNENQRQMVSHAGIAGHEARKIAEFVYPWTADDLLIMHSDGLQTRWNLHSHPGLKARCPTLIAGLLYRDFNRRTDDITILAIKQSV